MNKVVYCALIGIIGWSAYAVDVKKRIYRKEATQKLQEKIDSMEMSTQLLTPEFLTTINTLIDQGADPNVGHTIELETYDYNKKSAGPIKKMFSPLLHYLVIGATLVSLDEDGKFDLGLIERVTKNALQHGADPNVTDSVRGYLGATAIGSAIEDGSPAQVQMLLDHGADLATARTKFGDRPEAVLEKNIKNAQEYLEHAKIDDPDRIRLQNRIQRYEKIRAILKAAEQK